MPKIKWCSAIKLKCFSNFPWWFQPNHDVPKNHHNSTELAFSPGKTGSSIILRACSSSLDVCKVPRALRGVVMWREQCPGSRIPPGLALAEVEQVHLKLLDFWLICSVLYELSWNSAVQHLALILNCFCRAGTETEVTFSHPCELFGTFIGVCTIYFPVKYFLSVVERLHG